MLTTLRIALTAILSYFLGGSALAAPFDVHGQVRDATNGAAIGSARVTLDTPAGQFVGATASDGRGRFAFAARSGAYRIVVEASGYETGSTVLPRAGPWGDVIISLARAKPLRELGQISAQAGTTARAPATQSISREALSTAGAMRTSDALKEFPGVDVSGDTLSPGGDAYVSLRGLRPAESLVLLDGHPIGPIGVRGSTPDSDGTIAGFNFQDAPLFALRSIDIDFGAGMNGEAGSQAVGGTIDLRTIDPTQRSIVALEQKLGSQGQASTSLRLTGSADKLSYALVTGVDGTTGLFPGATIAQSGLRGTDFTSATLDGLTYHVSGDYVVRNQFVKIAYAPAANTRLTLTTYDATSWSDKTGEGDNDYNPYAYVLANAPVGNAPRCPHGVLVTENSGPACLSPGAYAAAASGPAGGGPGAWQALGNQDYDARLTRTAGRSDIAVDLFTDDYGVLYHRDASLVNGPLDEFVSRWSTEGIRLSDDVAGSVNSWGFGLTWLRQTLDGDGTAPGDATVVSDVPISRIDRGLFVRDNLSVAPHVALLTDVWLQSTSIDPVARVDPQLSVVYRPRASDALRLSAGGKSDEPSLATDRVNLLPVGALNPNCGAIARATVDSPEPVNVGSGPPSKLTAERGSDLEFGYEHSFGAGGNLGLTLYDANVTDRIFTGAFAAGSALPQSALPALYTRIEDFCGREPAPSSVVFTLNRPFNIASARLRGVDLSGYARATAHVSLHYAYDIESTVLDDLPASVLRMDPTLVNGLQVFGVPLHKASLGIAVATRGGSTFSLDGHAVGPNNQQQLPGYAYADASLEQRVSRRLIVTLSAPNAFNCHAQTYGLVGYGLPYATNRYGTSGGDPFLQTYNERYGLPPASFSLSAKVEI